MEKQSQEASGATQFADGDFSALLSKEFRPQSDDAKNAIEFGSRTKLIKSEDDLNSREDLRNNTKLNLTKELTDTNMVSNIEEKENGINYEISSRSKLSNMFSSLGGSFNNKSINN